MLGWPNINIPRPNSVPHEYFSSIYEPFYDID